MHLVFRLGWENDVDGFFLYDNLADAEEMCLALAEEELERKLYLDYMYCPAGFDTMYTHKMTLLDSCWFVAECQYIKH